MCHQERSAKCSSERSETRAIERVGEVNGLIGERQAAITKAGHHVGVSEHDVRRQGAMIVRRYLLSMSEPAIARQFPEALPQPVARSSDELRMFLLGVT